jgi:hypothetical protein
MLYSVRQNNYMFSKNIFDYIIPKFEFYEEEKSDTRNKFFKRKLYVLYKSLLHNRTFSEEHRIEIYV